MGFNGWLTLDYVALVAEALAASSDTNHNIANGLAITAPSSAGWSAPVVVLPFRTKAAVLERFNELASRYTL